MSLLTASLSLRSRFRLLPGFLLLGGLVVGASAEQPPKAPVLRWQENAPGCTLTLGEDGRYRYGLTAEGMTVTLAADLQELEHVHHRVHHVMGFIMTVELRGEGPLYVTPENMTLEFLNHHNVIEHSLDPDNFAAALQDEAAEMEHQIERQRKKHPEKVEGKQKYFLDYQNLVTEFVEYLGSNALRQTRLQEQNRIATGWVFFSTSHKWISAINKKENLIARFPIGAVIAEFPITLPPKQGEVILHHRPD